MLATYLNTAIRNLGKHKLFSLINVAGLAIGMSAALVIYLLVHFDYTFDRHHQDGDRIYRVVSDLHFPGQVINNGGASVPLAEAARKEITGLENLAQCIMYDRKVSVDLSTLGNSERHFTGQQDIVFADAHFFQLFSRNWLAGNAATALNEPYQTVLTKSRAERYFPGLQNEEIIGKYLRYNDSIRVTVSGIISEDEHNTDLNFQEFISLSTIPNSGLKRKMAWNQWSSVNSTSLIFVKLARGTTVTQIEESLVQLRTKHAPNDFMKTANKLQPLERMHFQNVYDLFSRRQANEPTLLGLIAVAVFLLLLACINFINLTTARASARAKEIGVRKTMGGTRWQLLVQFLGETLLLTVLATLVSLALVPIIFRIFADFIPAGVSLRIFSQPHLLIFLAGLIIVVTFCAGFYPSLILSGLNPIHVLKNQQVSGKRSGRLFLRRSLTVSQFVIAQFFIIATIVVSKQIYFALQKDMGFRKEAIITFSEPDHSGNKGSREVMFKKINALSGIEMASLASDAPAGPGFSSTTIKYKDGEKEIESTVEMRYADSSYFNLYQIKLLAGRTAFAGTDENQELVINESFADLIGAANAEAAIGKNIQMGNRSFPVVGVVKDFNLKSIHSGIIPVAFSNLPEAHSMFHVLLKQRKAGQDSWSPALAALASAWKSVYPDETFNYDFFDESIANLYTEERHIAKLLKWATGLVVFISCLGMLGLVTFTTAQRRKEIGVRKVLGASFAQLAVMLSKDFLLLVLLAFLIAAPLSWWAMSDWLNNFTYRTSQNWWIFAGGGLIMVICALLTLGIQTLKSASISPVSSLRSE